MNGREMFRQTVSTRQTTNDKQTPKHKPGNQTNRCSGKSAGSRSLPKLQKAVKAATVIMSIKRGLNIEPTNLARI